MPSQKGFSPSFIIIGVVVLLVIGFLGYNLKFNEQRKPAYNTQIMYGYKDYDDYLKNRSDDVKTVDENFIKTVTVGKSKAEAAQYSCGKGFGYTNSNDSETAIKRFNQAWLLDHNQPCVYDGYGYYLTQSKATVLEAFPMYEKALSLTDPKSESEYLSPSYILVDYGEALDRCYIADNKRTDCLDKALDKLNKSLEIKDIPKAHRVLAFVYYHKGDYKEAWNQVHTAINGGISVKYFNNFLNDLKKDMPDPEGKY